MMTDYFRTYISFGHSALKQSTAQRRQMSIDNFFSLKVKEKLVDEKTGTHSLKGALRISNI